MGSISSESLQDIIIESLSLTGDGVGIFDKTDQLVFCNKVFAKVFALTADSAIGKTFSEIIYHTYRASDGLNIETDNIEVWLKNAFTKRRQRPYRRFEIDSKNNQWFLVTEQIVRTNYLYVYLTEITEKKHNEQRLHKLTAQLQEQASTDSLTGINNRRSFYEIAEIEFRRCHRNKHPIALLLLDLDFFKQVNDHFGHAAGDRVLQSFASTIKGLLRSYDIFGRIGGEEFSILLPDTNHSEALLIAERIREKIEQMTVEFEGHIISITASLGLSADCPNIVSLESFINDADKKLYQAKSNGRNQVISETGVA